MPETPLVPDRFQVTTTGIAWDVRWPTGIPHQDHVEMSGRQISVIVRWAVDSRCCLRLVRQTYWPGLRGRADDCRGYLCREFADDVEPAIIIDGHEERMVALKIARILLDGTFTAIHHPVRGLRLERCLFPATTGPHLVERWTLTNVTDRKLKVALGGVEYRRSSQGITGTNRITIRQQPQEAILAPGESLTTGFAVTASATDVEPEPVDVVQEETRRRQRLQSLTAVSLVTPEPVLDRLFQLSAQRTGESLFDTKYGLVHSPGGGDFYCGIWANDQIEYVAPWFGMAGDAATTEATINACRIFAAAMNPNGLSIPRAFDINPAFDLRTASSCHPEPLDERGDSAMYLSGVSRFLLGLGDAALARELWPALVWASEFCFRATTADGVVASGTDELEGRFATGAANLNTSCIAYDGYRHAALLARDLGHKDWEIRLKDRANALAIAIEKHFGATVNGFDTYRYFDGCEVLRGWIGMPLAVGLYQRATATTQALLGKDMLTIDGIRTEQGKPTVWDRTTLTALRGMILAGRLPDALPVLLQYAHRRMLGDHVPYPWEFEMGQMHLAAESSFFTRLAVEGFFGLRLEGLGRAVIEPRMPAAWPRMELKGIVIGGVAHQVTVENHQGALHVTIDSSTSQPRIRANIGATFEQT